MKKSNIIIELDERKTEIIVSVVAVIIYYMFMNNIAAVFEEGSRARNLIVALGGSGGGVIQAFCVGLATYIIQGLKKRKKELATLSEEAIPEELDAFSALSFEGRKLSLTNMKTTFESRLERVRFSIVGLQMLGLIGTLYGLTQAIAKSSTIIVGDYADRQLGLNVIVNDFSLAFGTTFVAIILTWIISFMYHRRIAQIDVCFAELEKRFVLQK